MSSRHKSSSVAIQPQSVERDTLMNRAKAFSAASPTSPLASITIPRRDLTERDVEIDILFCGVCHSDVHMVRNEWSDAMATVYPIVPGHEIVGRVTRVGSGVRKHKPGDLVGVGCLVDSDRACDACKAGLEQFCPNVTLTYGSPDKHLGGVTYGGYSDCVVVDEHFVLRMPETLDPAGAAPLLCAGITTYSPLRHWERRSGQESRGHRPGRPWPHGGEVRRCLWCPRGGVHDVGRQKRRCPPARGRRGGRLAKRQRDADAPGSFDFILDTVSAVHDVNAYLNLLRVDGALTLVGAPPKPLAVSAFSLIMGRRSLSGSNIGGIAETQEMLDFCGEHGITADVEIIPIQAVNDAYERLLKSDVKYRFSIDMASLRTEQPEQSAAIGAKVG